MDYIVWENPPSGVQIGTYSVGSSQSQLAFISVQFTSPFNDVPVVFVNPRSEDVPDAFVVSTTGVTPDGFTSNIYRVDSSSGWAQVHKFLAITFRI